MPLWQRIHGKSPLTGAPAPGSDPIVPAPEEDAGPTPLDIQAGEAPLWQVVQSQMRLTANQAPLWQRVHYRKDKDALTPPPPVEPVAAEESAEEEGDTPAENIPLADVAKGAAPLWSSVHEKTDTPPMWERVNSQRDSVDASDLSTPVPSTSESTGVAPGGAGSPPSEPSPKQSWWGRLFGGGRGGKAAAPTVSPSPLAVEDLSAAAAPRWAQVHEGKRVSQLNTWQIVVSRNRAAAAAAAAAGVPLVSPAVPMNVEENTGPVYLDVKPLTSVPIWQRVHIDGAPRGHPMLRE